MFRCVLTPKLSLYTADRAHLTRLLRSPMHIPSERVYNKMKSEQTSLCYVPAIGDSEIAFLIKAPTSSIKALIAGCSLKLAYGKKDAHLCRGASILDVPDAPLFISGIQREAEEHSALIRALQKRRFSTFLFNEMDICLAWTNLELADEDASLVLDFIGEESQLYVGPFTKSTSHSLDCFCFSIDNTKTYPEAQSIPTVEISPTLESWRSINAYFTGMRCAHAITIDDENEGEMLERAVWASLESVFPHTLYKSPQVKVGKKQRELTDVFSFYTYGSFLIETKDLSVLSAGYERDQERRTKGIQKQVKKAIAQLIGASKAFVRGVTIFDDSCTELHVERKQPPHCIVLITDLMHSGDWSEIEALLVDASRTTGAYFHLLDLHELIALLKGSSGKPELLDYNLIQRFKLFIKRGSVHIRSQQATNPSIKQTD